ncbi:hypothetical protein B0J18DRAFT_38852 [Chaetomium sp. MPI-SDFR-AT-0129]|nr:hypothetical protein B0J18DRAFT_38852 [Chaetomium sp. MPI-SDFR-AT-0129]
MADHSRKSPYSLPPKSWLTNSQLNAAIHHASAAITQRAVRDFGGKLVDTARRDIVAHFSAEALDDVADLIISKASDKFLDKCLEKRLLTIGAKPLINALAAAERLGYEPSDMVQVEPNERVIPQAPPSQPAPTNPPQNHPVAQCLKCFRTFAYPSAHEYHATHDVCSQIPPDNKGFEHACIHCGKGFTNVVDLQRHTEQQVCTTPRPAQTPQPRLNQAGTVVTRSPSSVHTPGAATIELHLPSTIPSAKPTPPTAGTGLPGDPYGHLTPDQIQSMNEDLRAAEEQFAPRFAEANEIADSGQRRAKLEGLRNSFGTKQSLIRKKYGVRLRERRTKAEIEAERARVMGRQPRNGASRPPPTPGSGLALTAPVAPAAGSGWTAANTPRTTANWEEHDAKRRRLSEAGGHHSPSRTLADDTPTRKVSGSYPTAATSSSSASSRPTTTYEQSGARIQIHIPTANSQHQQQKPGGSAHPDGVSGTASRTATPDGSHSGTGADSENRQQQQQHGHGRTGLSSAPVVIDDDDDSSSGDDEDIPSTLPSHVRKSLGASGSPSVVQKTP